MKTCFIVALLVFVAVCQISAKPAKAAGKEERSREKNTNNKKLGRNARMIKAPNNNNNNNQQVP
jgi:hypothetical protein